MENISLNNKSNFFEHKVGAYQKANVLNNWLDRQNKEEVEDEDKYVFRTDAEF